jgi:AcrR family transcriptional regulator
MSPQRDKSQSIGRNREETRNRILAAAARLVAQTGFHELGINAIAREAGVDKVLIYRYFGGLKELVRALSGQQEFWPTFEEQVGLNYLGAADLPPEVLGQRLLTGFLRELRRRPVTQEILRWELLEQSEITAELAQQRENWDGETVASLRALLDDEKLDVEALAALLSGGIIYLLLRAKTVGGANGIDLQSEAGWQRIEQALAALARRLFSAESPR